MSPRKGILNERVVLTWDEIVERYDGQWVLMEVTKSEDGWPSEGIVLAHAQQQSDISKAVTKLDRAPKPGAKYHLLEALHYIRTQKDLIQALEEAKRQGIRDAWGRW